MAMCVSDGRASAKETESGGGRPRCSRVHTPFGDRKSGTPDATEIPAPVCRTTCFASRNNAARRSSELSTTSALSKCSRSPQRPLCAPLERRALYEAIAERGPRSMCSRIP
eukprot:Amastigsp_a695631_4.p1 type:complete len:111 gc:universal Amastigsp_a695631_4:35-367(+)